LPSAFEQPRQDGSPMRPTPARRPAGSPRPQGRGADGEGQQQVPPPRRVVDRQDQQRVPPPRRAADAQAREVRPELQPAGAPEHPRVRREARPSPWPAPARPGSEPNRAGWDSAELGLVLSVEAAMAGEALVRHFQDPGRRPQARRPAEPRPDLSPGVFLLLRLLFVALPAIILITILVP
jgi:hypothetical protein